MNCPEKLLEPTIFFNLYTKSSEATMRLKKSTAKSKI